MEPPRVGRGGVELEDIYIYIYIYIYTYIYIYISIYLYISIWHILSSVSTPGCEVEGGVGEGCRDPPPYFEVGKHKKTCFGSESDGYYGVFAPTKGSQWLKIGCDITPTRILIIVLKITTEW